VLINTLIVGVILALFSVFGVTLFVVAWWSAKPAPDRIVPRPAPALIPARRPRVVSPIVSLPDRA
jgi:hypothetical protein